MADWMPIDSAPKDGSPRLLWRPGVRLAWIGMWSDWNRWWTTGEQDRYHDHVPCPAPTHWMPLPPPPALTDSNDHEGGGA